jgi:phosphatidylglycerophosphatase A
MSHRDLVRQVVKYPVHWPAFGFGLGLAPFAPGTWGSVLGVVFYWYTIGLGLTWYLLLVFVAFLAGIWICGESARRIGVHDHPGIVWDEVVGVMLTLAVAQPEPMPILLGFLLFRVFDIWKPWPIRDIDHSLKGGLGIMLDDVLAAIYAAVALYILQSYIPGI